MKIKFCGAARTVTGSSHLVTLDDGYQILLDCGLFQGKGKDVWDRNNTWHFDPAEIDCLILSHAHIDHTGRVPQLVKDGFNGQIISTHATRSLCSIMLLDSAYIQERDVEYYNRKLIKKRSKSKRKKFRVPLYTSEHVKPTMDLFITCGYDRWATIRSGVRVLFRDAGHILGSSSVTLEITEHGKTRTLAFSGDIGRPDRPILRDPRSMPPADFVIAESTYGNREHAAGPAEFDRFLSIIKHTCVDKGGKLIIPAFSVGRTQEIVYLLDRMESDGRLPKLPVYVDSPLAV
ncbi:MAG: MBL fold metallo-hydrolase, partial [Saprospiraceae bacterium]|nr:MBL fold metallo-hydrolase [Saprospiraceae bacterium]